MDTLKLHTLMPGSTYKGKVTIKYDKNKPDKDSILEVSIPFDFETYQFKLCMQTFDP